jgi:hypothetical protein
MPAEPQYEVAKTLTLIPDDFSYAIGPGSDNIQIYPASNDHFLGRAYKKALADMPETTADKTPVALIIGNGGIETVAQLIPENVAIIHADYNARTLFTLKVMREMISNCVDLPTFKSQQLTWERHFGTYLEDQGIRSTLVAAHYRDQLKNWHGDTTHFMQSNSAYKQARKELGRRAIGYRLFDINDPEAVEQLSTDIQAANGEIVLANFTNVNTRKYTSEKCMAHVSNTLPFNPEAMIISSRSRLNSYWPSAATRRLAEWRSKGY